MEDLIPVIIIFVISSIFSAVKKKEQQKAAEAKQWNGTSARVHPTPARAKPITRPVPAKHMMPSAPKAAPAQVMQPTVHTHLQPDCDVHDASGSLSFASTEGKDPCHEPQLTHIRTVEAGGPQEGGLTFDWTGDSMVKAVVMQEVLTRPVQRRAR